jgi:hypothetical protein
MLLEATEVYINQDKPHQSTAVNRWPLKRELATSVLRMTAVVPQTCVK